MIRFRLRELLAEKGFKERRIVTISEVAQATGINRMTLSKIANHPGYSTVTENLDKLCNFFQCPLSALAEHIADENTQPAREIQKQTEGQLKQ